MSDNSDNQNEQNLSESNSNGTSTIKDDLPDDIDIEYDEGENNTDDEVDEVTDSEDENNEEVNTKYTKIDNLDEDKVISGQTHVCISFVSPEGVMNTTLRSVKIRGVFDSEEKAKAHAAKLQKKDKYFDVFVGEVGKWLPWDPDPHSVSKMKYGDKKMQKLADAQQKKQQDKLNELVGRKKELIDKKSKGHDRRVADQIVSGANEEGGSTVNNSKQKKEKPHKPSGADRLEQIRARMRKSLEEKKKNKEKEVQKTNEAALLEDRDRQLKNVNARTEELNKDMESSNKIEENINKIKQFMANKSK